MAVAEKVPRPYRRAFLRSVARNFDGTDIRRAMRQATPPRTRAGDQRAYRQREETGELTYRVTIIPQVIEGLIAIEKLTDATSHDRKVVEKKLSALLNEWSQK